jgi:hypothetical protein
MDERVLRALEQGELKGMFGPKRDEVHTLKNSSRQETIKFQFFKIYKRAGIARRYTAWTMGWTTEGFRFNSQ